MVFPGTRLRRLGWATMILLAISGNALAAAVDIRNEAVIKSARGKVVLLDFWASWCEPCRKSFPWMNTLQQKYGERGLTVIAVNMDQQAELAAEFLKQIPVRFRLEYDPQGTLATRLNVVTMPSSFLLDRNGNMVRQHAGFREAQLPAREQEIEKLLQE